jgi:hypothetical protein
MNASTENGHSQANAEVNVQIGTSYGVEATRTDGNVRVELEYFDGVHVEARVGAGVSAPGGCGATTTGGVYVTDGTLIAADVAIGKKGVDASGEVAIGTAVGADAEVTTDIRYVSGTVGGGVSAGQQLSAGGGATATYDRDSATLGLSGDVAAVVGLDVDVAVTVDYETIVQDVKYVKDVSPSTFSSLSNSVSDTSKKTGKKVKKVFKF